MKIQLIEAAHPVDGLAWGPWLDRDGRFAMPSPGVASVASLVGPEHEVSYVDQRVGQVSDVDADVVAISTSTMYSPHAYRMADEYRARGVKVVLGGTHPTLQPDEAALHADVVVAGEAEAVWPVVLRDLARGDAQGIYRAPAQHIPLATLPEPAVDVFDHERYMLHAVQSARGCSFSCEFCPTRAMFGGGFRLRAIDIITHNIQRLREVEDKPVFFTENVFGAGNLPFVTELTQWFKNNGVRYGVICDWFMLTQPIVDCLEAGDCGLVCVNLTGREEPKEIAALEAISKAGIPIWGYYMFGFEEDTPDVFERAVKRAHTYDLCCTTLTVLTPFPGTPMGDRLAREGRIFSHERVLYDHAHVLFEPTNMTVDQLQQGFDYVCDELADRVNFSNAAAALAGSR